MTSGLGELAGDAEAIVSELVANAVRHAASPADVALIMAGGALMIITGDSSPVPPAMSTAGDDAESGLVIVDAVTTGRWGWWNHSSGKLVWASLSFAPLLLRQRVEIDATFLRHLSGSQRGPVAGGGSRARPGRDQPPRAQR